MGGFQEQGVLHWEFCGVSNPINTTVQGDFRWFRFAQQESKHVEKVVDEKKALETVTYLVVKMLVL